MIKYSDLLTKDIITPILKKNVKEILFNQCWNWYEDKTYMPKKLSRELFTDWFDYEVIDVLLDTVKGDIEKGSVD